MGPAGLAGHAGPTGLAGPTGPAGLTGPAGPGAPSHSYLYLPLGTPAPPGYVLVGAFVEDRVIPVGYGDGDRDDRSFRLTIQLWQKQ
jgi:hypothetical protein